MTKKPDIQSFEIHTMDIKITENGYIFEKDLRSKRLLIFLISFSVVWYLFTWNIYGGETPQFKSINYEILRHIFFFIVSLSSSYFTLVIAFNKHKLVINEKYTQTKCVPLPWFSNYKINRSRIGQIYVEKYKWFYINGRPVYRFSVKAISLGGNLHSYVIKGLQYYEEALIIEKYLRELWDIEDNKTSMEYLKIS